MKKLIMLIACFTIQGTTAATTIMTANANFQKADTTSIWQTATATTMCNKQKGYSRKKDGGPNQCIEPFLLIQSAGNIGLSSATRKATLSQPSRRLFESAYFSA